MAVVDAAYTFDKWPLSLAIAYGYASGDENPHKEAKNKTHNGFVGLHECYIGKRVKSVFYDDRVLQLPFATRSVAAAALCFPY